MSTRCEDGVSMSNDQGALSVRRSSGHAVPQRSWMNGRRWYEFKRADTAGSDYGMGEKDAPWTDLPM